MNSGLGGVSLSHSNHNGVQPCLIGALLELSLGSLPALKIYFLLCLFQKGERESEVGLRLGLLASGSDTSSLWFLRAPGLPHQHPALHCGKLLPPTQQLWSEAICLDQMSQNREEECIVGYQGIRPGVGGAVDG